jgi:NAD(P)-dependent dehydrogenase (short-subunit alcohol dehydrogenase family)
MPVAIVTGASRGFGRAVAHALAERDWSLVLDARGEAALRAALAELPAGRTVAIAGDVSDPDHRVALVHAAERLGGVDLLINNASELGPSPLPDLAAYPVEELARLYATNVVAPLALVQSALPLLLARNGAVVNVSSDAGVETYAGWGGYGSSKAALDHLSRVLTLEQPALSVYAFDPGDMRTEMHQRAFPGEDISDRPEPETVAPALLRLLDERPASGRYRAAELLVAEVVR